MSLTTLHNSVRHFLSSHHMYVVDDWLTGCVEYLTEDSSNNYSENDVKNLAKEQWLLNDLKDICPGSLPVNLKAQTKTTLAGRFVLQINAAIDIGTPAYQQYLKLQKINMENVEATIKFEDKISNHRMVKLYMTDGVQEVTGIEYKPMRNLSCDLTPGCKVLIKGPVECRLGTLLLSEGAIELLGGEVEDIAVSHSLAGLLSAKLGLPVTQVSEPNRNSTISQPRNANIPTLHAQMPPAPTLEPTDQRPVARVTCLQAYFNDDDLDIDQLAAIEAEFTDTPVKTSIEGSSDLEKRLANQGSSNLEMRLTNDGSSNLEKRSSNANSFVNPEKRTLSEGSSNPEKRIRIDIDTAVTSNTNKTRTTNAIDDYPDDNDLFFDEDEDYLRELEAKIAASEMEPNPKVNKVSNVSPEPFVYIKQINDMAVSEKAGRVYNVKGQIMKLLSKLSISKDGWSLKCTLVDGSGSLDVDFTSDVLSKLVGYTPQEMNQLKKQMGTKPELKEKAALALQKARETLQVLYCIIELTILEVPKITRLMPYDATHVDLLKKRMEHNL